MRLLRGWRLDAARHGHISCLLLNDHTRACDCRRLLLILRLRFRILRRLLCRGPGGTSSASPSEIAHHHVLVVLSLLLFLLNRSL